MQTSEEKKVLFFIKKRIVLGKNVKVLVLVVCRLVKDCRSG